MVHRPHSAQQKRWILLHKVEQMIDKSLSTRQQSPQIVIASLFENAVQLREREHRHNLVENIPATTE